MARDYQVGVLFVHGMGEQSRGDTIGDMGEALTDWLRREDEGRQTRLKGAQAGNVQADHPTCLAEGARRYVRGRLYRHQLRRAAKRR